MKTIDPAQTTLRDLSGYLNGAIAPRPIAFASTVDAAGRVNLSPFSYFNVFGLNPVTLVFSPNNRARDNTPKHTLLNVQEVPEVVINLLDYSLVQQASLASAEYPRGVNEFVKAGFTETPSERVRPPRVAESPVSFECRVQQIIPVGQGPGAANLVICEVLLMHISEKLLDENGKIDSRKTDWVGRMGGEWYCRASGNAVFEVVRPNQRLGIGFDQLPEAVRNSRILTGNELAQLANIEALPEQPKILDFSRENQNLPADADERHRRASQFLAGGDREKAWLMLLA
ncbi:MAG: flavin reductase family protein [Cytophagaceae bacterium]|nr:flavin reductase family protein [Cytophagaceae bacterium]